jgi:hypothetical protein
MHSFSSAMRQSKEFMAKATSANPVTIGSRALRGTLVWLSKVYSRTTHSTDEGSLEHIARFVSSQGAFNGAGETFEMSQSKTAGGKPPRGDAGMNEIRFEDR